MFLTITRIDWFPDDLLKQLIVIAYQGYSSMEIFQFSQPIDALELKKEANIS